MAISPQTQAQSAAVKRDLQLDFPILSDAGNAYARRLSIAFTPTEDLQDVLRNAGIVIPDYSADGSWDLPMPTRIVVDRDGVIRSIESDPDYMQRTEPSSTLAALKEKIRSTSQRLLRNLRTELEAERRRSHDLLLNILPAAIAAELRREGRVEPRNVEAATVLFTDVQDFTAKAARMSASELVSKLGECFTAFDDIVEKHDIEKLKTVGDAYMCAGGLLGDGDDHTHRMVRAAWEMRDWIAEWNQVQSVAAQGAWGVRIGIHCGPLVAGVIGTRKFAFDVWGDTVNVASRLESTGEIGKVNVSRDVVDALGAACRAEARGPIRVKNRGEMEMFFVEPAR